MVVQENDYIVIYVRVLDDKKLGMQFEGPFIGPRAKTMEEAEEKAKSLTNKKADNIPKKKEGTIIPKIYEMSGMAYYDVIEESKDFFYRLRDRMLESEEILKRPKKRKRKKKKR